MSAVLERAGAELSIPMGVKQSAKVARKCKDFFSLLKTNQTSFMLYSVFWKERVIACAPAKLGLF